MTTARTTTTLASALLAGAAAIGLSTGAMAQDTAQTGTTGTQTERTQDSRTAATATQQQQGESGQSAAITDVDPASGESDAPPSEAAGKAMTTELNTGTGTDSEAGTDTGTDSAQASAGQDGVTDQDLRDKARAPDVALENRRETNQMWQQRMAENQGRMQGMSDDQRRQMMGQIEAMQRAGRIPPGTFVVVVPQEQMDPGFHDPQSRMSTDQERYSASTQGNVMVLPVPSDRMGANQQTAQGSGNQGQGQGQQQQAWSQNNQGQGQGQTWTMPGQQWNPQARQEWMSQQRMQQQRQQAQQAQSDRYRDFRDQQLSQFDDRYDRWRADQLSEMDRSYQQWRDSFAQRLDQAYMEQRSQSRQSGQGGEGNRNPQIGQNSQSGGSPDLTFYDRQSGTWVDPDLAYVLPDGRVVIDAMPHVPGLQVEEVQ